MVKALYGNGKGEVINGHFIPKETYPTSLQEDPRCVLKDEDTKNPLQVYMRIVRALNECGHPGFKQRMLRALSAAPMLLEFVCEHMSTDAEEQWCEDQPNVEKDNLLHLLLWVISLTQRNDLSYYMPDHTHDELERLLTSAGVTQSFGEEIRRFNFDYVADWEFHNTPKWTKKECTSV